MSKFDMTLIRHSPSKVVAKLTNAHFFLLDNIILWFFSVLYVGIGVLFLINLILNCHNRSLIHNQDIQVQVPKVKS